MDLQISAGDTGFIMICSALVFLMTPGLAFFYAGMVRRKNALNTLLSCFFICGLASLMWIICGYSLSFGTDHGGVLGGVNKLFFTNVSMTPNSDYASSIPETLFAAFQMMFAIITPALICGAVAERMKFSRLVIFIGVWSLLVYYPLAHMVWGAGGFLRELGALDFAGGNVVHISSGVTGLVACIILGKRRGYGMLSYKPHNIPFVVLGAGLLWFGWFGFNAGSALSASPLAVHAFLTTNTSAAAALISWLMIEKLVYKKVTVLGAATGCVIGLVAITPGAGFVPVWASIIIGFVVSPICFFFMSKVKGKYGYDDALDAFGCHGIGGIWGGIATGLFAKQSINPDVIRWNGLVYGEARLLGVQLLSIIVTILIAVVMSFIILKVMKYFGDLRVNVEDEAIGLDLSEHNEAAYPAYNGLD